MFTLEGLNLVKLTKVKCVEVNYRITDKSNEICPEGCKKKEYNFGRMQLQLALLDWSVSLDGQK